jgi:hypothetical protein
VDEASGILVVGAQNVAERSNYIAGGNLSRNTPALYTKAFTKPKKRGVSQATITSACIRTSDRAPYNLTQDPLLPV